jgi:hypothetical protein
VVEAVRTQESMNQALHATRPGGHVGFVGVAHGVSLDGRDLFWSLAHLHGGPAPVRRFLPQLIELIWNRQIDPGRSSISNCRLTRRPTATARWTSAKRSRSSCIRDRPRRRRAADEPRGWKLHGQGGVHHRCGEQHWHATALAFARAGASVIVADLADDGDHESAWMVEESGGRALAVRCDV